MQDLPEMSIIEAEISADKNLPVLVRQVSSLVHPCPSRDTDSAKARNSGISLG